jgi:23S rRNA U2552 (ribose-2'-O)-methylase RlmE/FtsJ
MTKDELMRLTLQQLTENFYLHPECFVLEDPEVGSDLKGISNSIITFQSAADPNSNTRAVVITYNETIRMLTCNIYFKTIPPNGITGVKPDAYTSVRIEFRLFNGTYKKFRKLRAAMIKNFREKENNEFLKKLHSVFPGTFDDFIFGE